MPWVTFVPVLLLAAVIFLGPGLLVMRGAGVRGLPLFAVSGPTTVTIASAVAVAAPYAGVGYGIVPVAACALVLTVTALVLRYVLAMRGIVFGAQPRKSFLNAAQDGAGTGPILTPAQEWVRRGAIVAAFAIPAVIIAVRFARIIGAPGNISQTYDNIFHLNAIGHILITGSGSSLTLGNLTTASAAFYPAAWHDLIALVASTASVSVPEAISAGNIVIAAVMWPLGMMYLISRISSGHVLPMLLTGALAAGFSSFPYLMIDFGVLYPNLLAIAIMPVALALTIDLLGLNPTKRRIVPVLCQGILILPGLALAHPSFVVALFGLALPLLLTKLVRLAAGFRRGEASGRQLVGFTVLTAVFIPLVFIVWDMAGQSLTSSRWQPYQTVSQAIGEVLGAGPQGRHVSLVMFVMLVAGLVASIARRKLVWVLGMAFIAAGLFVVASALPASDTRHFLTGVWYNDSFRLAAMLPVVLLPLAVLGGESILRGAAAIATQQPGRRDGQQDAAPSRRHGLGQDCARRCSARGGLRHRRRCTVRCCWKRTGPCVSQLQDRAACPARLYRRAGAPGPPAQPRSGRGQRLWRSLDRGFPYGGTVAAPLCIPAHRRPPHTGRTCHPEQDRRGGGQSGGLPGREEAKRAVRPHLRRPRGARRSPPQHRHGQG